MICNHLFIPISLLNLLILDLISSWKFSFSSRKRQTCFCEGVLPTLHKLNVKFWQSSFFLKNILLVRVYQDQGWNYFSGWNAKKKKQFHTKMTFQQLMLGQIANILAFTYLAFTECSRPCISVFESEASFVFLWWSVSVKIVIC